MCILQKNYEHLRRYIAFFEAMRYDKRYVYRDFTKKFKTTQKGVYHGKQYCRTV